MNTATVRQLQLGSVVYHSIFTHYGPGRVVRIDRYLDERRQLRWELVVRFEGAAEDIKVNYSALRMTPPRSKIRKMVAAYSMAGKTAKDGGDRLILPS